MNIQSEKIQLAKMILELESEKVLKHLKAILSSYDTDLWDNLNESQKASIKLARTQIKRGEGKSHSEVMKKYKKWLTK